MKTGLPTPFPRPRLKTQTLPGSWDLGRLADEIKQRLIEIVRAKPPTGGEESAFLPSPSE